MKRSRIIRRRSRPIATPQAILIAGPTASGKSALAMRVAEALGGVVVNADSMQVYRDLRVLTARPSPEEERRVPHRLYGHVDGAENHSVGRYVADAAALVEALRREGRPAVVTGGTGLYFKAITDGLSEIPPVPDAVRGAVRRETEGLPTPEIHARLAALDPETAAALRPSDRLRVQRALEVFAATGAPLARLRGPRRPGPLHGAATVRLFLAPDRATLRGRIDERFLAMIAGGALEEVEALGARGLDPMLPVMRAHGVPALLAYLRGETTREAAVAAGQRDTRAYAKRQFTWFRNQMPGWTWIDPTLPLDPARLVAAGGEGSG